MSFSHRPATAADLPRLKALMALAIDRLQTGFLTPEQVVASRAVMGLDTQLVADGTYFLVESDGRLAGCGGWSRRATLYGGDHSTDLREPRLLDPASEAARVRAMYTHPDFARRGVGRLILSLCEAAAAREGFTRAELMATLAGEPLYRACGYVEIERVADNVDGVPVPLVRMGKPLTPPAA
ncbi:GNAT family N-acetyltransferase [Sphingomonas sp. DT-204]|uniref:GNAT family N-acetyltransferase n=1 Tax=Sphingomonas sp. DT-204 TaxID=3396166 RepID=UPI003F1AA518